MVDAAVDHGRLQFSLAAGFVTGQLPNDEVGLPPPRAARYRNAYFAGLSVGAVTGLAVDLYGLYNGAGFLGGGGAVTVVASPTGPGALAAAGAGLVLGSLIGAAAHLDNLGKAREHYLQSKAPDDPAGSEGGLTQSPHAISRGAQGRRIQAAAGDVQRARPADVFRQSDGRLVVRGPRGREHIIEPNGELVTTINQRSRKAHLQRLRDRTIEPATDAEYEFLKSLVE